MQTEIWIAISVYLLVAIVRKRLDSRLKLYTLLRILSVTLFEKTSLEQAFSTRITQVAPTPPPTSCNCSTCKPDTSESPLVPGRSD